MELRRRQFIKLVGATAAAVLAGAWGALSRVLPERVVRAARARRFAGKIRRLDPAQVSKPGPWRG